MFCQKTNEGFSIAKDLLQISENEVTGAPVDKLGRLEAMCKVLLKEQEQLAQQMDKLRLENKEKTARFRELLGKKIVNGNLLGIMEVYDLLEK